MFHVSRSLWSKVPIGHIKQLQSIFVFSEHLNVCMKLIIKVSKT